MTTLIPQWKLTLQYDDASKQQTWQFSDQQPTKNPDTIRIGRDNLRCDIVLQDKSVSSLHVEIFFNQLQNRFFIRNLRGLQNLPLVDGVLLYPDKEFSLYNNSVICLGKQKLKVTDISISGVSNLDATNLDYSPKPDQEGSSGKDTNKNKKLWKDATVVVAIITSIFTFGGVLLSQYTERQKITSEQTKTNLQIKAEQKKLDFQVKADKEKLMQELLSKKQENAEKRYYEHKAEVLKLQNENTNIPNNQIILKNSCDKSINIAVNFTALNDIEQTRGWNVIEPRGTIKPSYFVRSGTIFLHAEATESKDNKLEWEGNNYREKYTIDSHFDYIADDITILISGDKERKVKNLQMKKFYGINFDQNGVTTKTFTCRGDRLELS
jgi:hypothetical protein